MCTRHAWSTPYAYVACLDQGQTIRVIGVTLTVVNIGSTIYNLRTTNAFLFGLFVALSRPTERESSFTVRNYCMHGALRPVIMIALGSRRTTCTLST